MRQVCYICGILYGIKDPIEDDRETHGLCPDCFEIEMRKLQELDLEDKHRFKEYDPTS